jgi:hypothetical protein
MRGKEVIWTYPDEPVLGLKLLLRFLIIVDQTETLGGSTSELGLQAKDNNPLLLGLVQSGELVAELISGQVGSSGVEDGNDELLSVEQSVGDELGSSDSNGAGSVLIVSSCVPVLLCLSSIVLFRVGQSMMVCV